MRTIKFRGLDLNGNWYYGNLTVLTTNVGIHKKGSYISNSVGMPFAYAIRPETVGQFTGLSDKQGKEIYCGDIVKPSGVLGMEGEIGVVEWRFDSWDINWRYAKNLGKFDYQLSSHELLEIIENIYESKHLQPAMGGHVPRWRRSLATTLGGFDSLTVHTNSQNPKKGRGK